MLKNNYKNLVKFPCQPCGKVREDELETCPDFEVNQYSTAPEFRVRLNALDKLKTFDNLAAELNVWSETTLSQPLDLNSSTLEIEDKESKVLVGDGLILGTEKQSEHLMVNNVDKDGIISVRRNAPQKRWEENTPLRIYRIFSAPVIIEIVLDSVKQPDGEIEESISSMDFVYHWNSRDTCLSGLYHAEIQVYDINPDWKPSFFTHFIPWNGPVHTDTSGSTFSGSFPTDSSVKLENQNGQWFVSPIQYEGKHHLGVNDSVPYSGSIADDGSVILHDRPQYLGHSCIPDPDVIDSFRLPLFGKGYTLQIHPRFSTDALRNYA